MRVLLTGANGLLGHHTAFEFLRRGIDMNIIVRSTKEIHFRPFANKGFCGQFRQ